MREFTVQHCVVHQENRRQSRLQPLKLQSLRLECCAIHLQLDTISPDRAAAATPRRPFRRGMAAGAASRQRGRGTGGWTQRMRSEMALRGYYLGAGRGLGWTYYAERGPSSRPTDVFAWKYVITILKDRRSAIKNHLIGNLPLQFNHMWWQFRVI
jgi:hypothetical protein